MNQINKNITIGKCYNCSTNMDYYQNTFCGGLCFICWQCKKIQYLDDDDKINKWHNPQCEDYNNCYHCDKNIDLDKNNIIDYTNNNYIFNKEPEKFIAKYNNMFYHYDCLCESTNKHFMKLFCTHCKIFCENIYNMRNICNMHMIGGIIGRGIYVCIECYDNSDVPKCVVDGHNNPILICCYTRGEYVYANGCEKCVEEDFMKQYCDRCR
jgi:hypothetical protein